MPWKTYPPNSLLWQRVTSVRLETIILRWTKVVHQHPGVRALEQRSRDQRRNALEIVLALALP